VIRVVVLGKIFWHVKHTTLYRNTFWKGILTTVDVLFKEASLELNRKFLHEIEEKN